MKDKEGSFEAVKSLIEGATNMTDSEKAFVLTALWTHDQVPEITSNSEYELYSKRQRELWKGALLPNKTDPGYREALVAFVQSSNGILANSYGARMWEWEEKQEKGEAK
jgi:hypothetical protein